MVPAGGFRGVYPMLYAFFDGHGRLDRAAMRAQVEYCVANGAHWIAALNTHLTHPKDLPYPPSLPACPPYPP
jgi:hypothetical protein